MNKILAILIAALFLTVMICDYTINSVQYSLENMQEAISDNGYKNFTSYLSEDIYQKLDQLKYKDENVNFLINNIQHTVFDYTIIQKYNKNHIALQIEYNCKTLQTGSFIMILDRQSWMGQWYIVDIYNHNLTN